ncbi:MAG: hypothetical protein K0Q95_3328 [Bacteroidota bacterium]|jgi:hypothetical protein|nr:hypothetical protein [Bacteroidota bacterium]
MTGKSGSVKDFVQRNVILAREKIIGIEFMCTKSIFRNCCWI